MFTATLDFSKLTPEAGLIRGLEIHNKMSGSVHFPDPPVPYVNLQTASDELEVAIVESVDGGKDRLLTRNLKLAAVIAILRPYKDYVNMVAQGDQAIIEASGFDLSQPAEPITSYTAPGDLRVRSGSLEGTIKALWGGVRGNKIYEVQISETPNDAPSWQAAAQVTKNRVVLSDLTPGVKYFVRVRATGTAGVGPWSETGNARAK